MRGIAIALVAMIGCASETGIMLVISTGEVAASPDEIIVFVGGPMDEVDGVAAAFNDPDADRFEIDGDRDLAADPIRYLIRPGEVKKVRVAAVGLGEQLAAPLTAHYDGELEFVTDVVLEVKLVLEQRGTEEFDECSLCFSTVGDNPFQISSPFDADCDGSRPAGAEAPECEGANPFEPPDCDDHDAGRNARLIETCDGRDNDCDQSEQVETACFAAEADACQIGTRECAGGQWGACGGLGDPDGNIELCNDLSDCTQADDPIACFKDKSVGGIVNLDCEIEIAAPADSGDGDLCSTGVLMQTPADCAQLMVLAVEGPPGAQQAVRFGQQRSAAVPGASTLCEGEPSEVALDGPLARGARYLFYARGVGEEDSALHIITLAPKYVESCGVDGDAPVMCVSQ